MLLETYTTMQATSNYENNTSCEATSYVYYFDFASID
jgi:hypothetical protein